MPYPSTYGSREATLAEAIADALVARGIGLGGGGSGGSGTSASNSLYAQIINAPDLQKTFNYADAGTQDERITSIVMSSPSMEAVLTDTYTYAGSASNYRIASITRSYSEWQAS